MLEHFKKLILFILISSNLLDLKTHSLSPLKPRFLINLFNNFYAVEKGKLYRSAQLRAKMLKFYIEKYGIKTLINLRGVNNKKWYLNEARVSNENNINFHSIPMSASSLPSKSNLLKLLRLYDEAPKPILIHCQGGADRTGEAAALWVLEKQKKSKEKALKQLSIQYLHFKYKRPAKDFLIKIWQGREWLENEYNPQNFPKFAHIKTSFIKPRKLIKNSLEKHLQYN